MKRQPLYVAGHEVTVERTTDAQGVWYYAKAFDEDQNIVARNGAKTRERALVLIAFELGRYVTAGKGRRRST